MFYKIVTKTFEIVVKSCYKVKVIGKENIPKEGACIIAPNHKSNWDAIMISGLIRERKINALAKKELFKNSIAKFIFSKLNVIPVDRDKPELSTIKSVLKVLKNDEILAIFPEGTRHKDLDSFENVKAGVGMFALKSKAPVVPISIVTNYKLFSELTIVVGETMKFDEYYNKKNTSQDYEEVSNKIMDKIKTNYFNIKNGK